MKLHTVPPLLLLPLVLQDAEREQREPPARFDLTVGERTIEVTAGVPFELELGGETARCELVPRPTRRLAVAGLAFDYPAAMTFEYEDGLGVRMWTLDGNDATVMVHRYAFPTSLDDVVDGTAESLAESFGEPARGAAEIELDGRTFAGASLVVDTGGFCLRSEIFLLADGAKGRNVLVLQDVRDDPGTPSEEFARVCALLGESFASGQRR